MSTALITGASSGIGEAIARRVAAQKENLVLVARNEAKLRHLSQELAEKFKVNVEFIVADLYDLNAPQAIYQECKKRNLVIESLINNAGIGSGGEFSGADLKSLQDMMQLNNGALVSLTHLFMQDMQRLKKGIIVNIGSLISFMPVPYMTLYGATKTFVRFFSEALYEECKPYGVHVLYFAPGLTITNFLEAANLKNNTGDALIAGAPTQTADQVADEFIKAYTKKKKFKISGGLNRFAAKLLALVPNAFIAKQSAKSFQKRISQKA